VVKSQARELASQYDHRRTTLSSIAPQVIKALSRPGLRVVAIDHIGPARSVVRSGYQYEVHVEKVPVGRSGGAANAPHADPHGGPPMGRETPAGRFFFGFAALIGLHPARVPFLDGAILIMPDVDHIRAVFIAYFAVILPLGVVAAIVAGFAGRYITSQALRPLYEVTEALEAFASGDFTPREIPAARRSDFRALASAYNGAAQQVAGAFAQREVAQQHMRQFVADAGHELRTPLTIVMGFIDVLRRRVGPESEGTRKIFDTIAIESHRMRVLIDNLVLLARLDRVPETSAKPVDISAIAEHVVETRRPLAPLQTFAFEGAPGALAVMDEFELNEAIGNLVDNAIKYAPAARIDVRVEADERRVAVRVSDSGPGMTPEEVEHAFDRFYRGESRGEIEGSGLGLAIVKRAVERANGTIVVISRTGEGSAFTIELPRSSDGERGAYP